MSFLLLLEDDDDERALTVAARWLGTAARPDAAAAGAALRNRSVLEIVAVGRNIFFLVL